jgi:hypothetical protein
MTFYKSLMVYFFTVTFLFYFLGCTRRNCNTKPDEYARLAFQLRDKNTGHPLIAAPSSFTAAPDSITMKRYKTNTVYSLKMDFGAYNETKFVVPDYKGKVGAVDTFEFRLEKTLPDTLILTIGTVKGWRGDECGFANDPGIVQVKQNGAVIYSYQPFMDSAFVIKK